MILRALTLGLLTTTALAQSPQSLPPNYQTILDNPDVLVMRVHYGPHEFVPMHDHSAYPTVYVYLNDSGEVRIDHEPPKRLLRHPSAHPRRSLPRRARHERTPQHHQPKRPPLRLPARRTKIHSTHRHQERLPRRSARAAISFRLCDDVRQPWVTHCSGRLLAYREMYP